MTDPLSVTAGTLAFVTAALSVAQSTCELIDNIKNAGLEVDSLASQMKEFIEVLRKLQQIGRLHQGFSRCDYPKGWCLS